MKNVNQINLNEMPHKPSVLFHKIIRLIVPLFQRNYKHETIKENFKKLKGGALVLSDHQSFEDFKFLERVIYPRTSYYVASVDEFVKKAWIMRKLGCILKKVHYTNMVTIKQIVKLLKGGNLVTIYPEATYSFCGVTNTIDKDLGKLAKLANVQVVVIHMYGSYLYSPKWNTKIKYNEVPIKAAAKIVCTKEEVAKLSANEIQAKIEEYFDYDEYKYQLDNNIRLTLNTRADNLHRILYKCPNCNTEKKMLGENSNLKCNACGANYYVNELNVLENTTGETKFSKISDWFKWEEKLEKDLMLDGKISYDFPVRIAKLIDLKEGFNHEYAYGIAHQDENGITITGKVKETNEDFNFEYTAKLNATLHLTFDVKGSKEQAFEVHTFDETYVVYPLDDTSNIKVRFYVEAAHEKAMLSNKKDKSKDLSQ